MKGSLCPRLVGRSLSTCFNSSSLTFLFLRCFFLLQLSTRLSRALRDRSSTVMARSCRRRDDPHRPRTSTHAHKRRDKEKGVNVTWSEIDSFGVTMRRADTLRFDGLDGGSERFKLDCRIASDSHREALLGLASGNGVVVCTGRQGDMIAYDCSQGACSGGSHRE